MPSPPYNAYDIGDEVYLTAAFTDENGDPADPTTVTFRSRKPDGTVTTYVYGIDAQVEYLSLGNYAVTLSVDLAGTWFYRWEGSDDPAAAEENIFTVRRSEFYAQ